jgi:hypothetical protein
VRVDEAEAAVVRQIFAWYSEEQATLYSVATRLRAHAVRTARGLERWNVSSIRGMLTNPAYTGFVYMGRRRPKPATIRRSATQPIGRPHSSSTPVVRDEWVLVATIPPIITQQQFDLVQAKLARNQRFARRNNTAHEYLLRALVSCGACRLACTGRTIQSGYSYYACRAKNTAISSCREQKCLARLAPARQLDELVWTDLCQVLTHPDILAQALERAWAGNWLPQELHARRDGLRRGIASIDHQIERMTEAYVGDVIGLEEYRRRRGELEQKRQALLEQELQLQVQVDRRVELAGVVASVEDFCRRVQAGLSEATFEQKRMLVELLVDRVVVTNAEVEIRYVVPIRPTGETTRFCHLRLDYFDEPSGRVAGDPLAGLCERGHLAVDEQNPLERLDSLGRRRFPHPHNAGGNRRSCAGRAPRALRRLDHHLARRHRDEGRACGLLGARSHLHLVVPERDGGSDPVKQLLAADGVDQRSIVSGPDRIAVAEVLRQPEILVKVRLAIRDALPAYPGRGRPHALGRVLPDLGLARRTRAGFRFLIGSRALGRPGAHDHLLIGNPEQTHAQTPAVLVENPTLGAPRRQRRVQREPLLMCPALADRPEPVEALGPMRVGDLCPVLDQEHQPGLAGGATHRRSVLLLKSVRVDVGMLEERIGRVDVGSGVEEPRNRGAWASCKRLSDGDCTPIAGDMPEIDPLEMRRGPRRKIR